MVIDFKELHAFKAEILQVVEQKRSYLGQMDVCIVSSCGISMKKL
jgi:hypothetical protein